MSQVLKMVKHFLFQELKKVSQSGVANFWKYSQRSSAATLLYSVSAKDDKKSRINFSEVPELTHKQMIQQSCTAAVNSASQLLTCTVVALVEAGQNYRNALEDQLSLMEESLNDIGNIELQNELTDLLTEARSKVATFNKHFMELNSLMEYVEKLVVSTTEASYLADAETASMVLSERLHSAKMKIDEQNQLNKKLEDELVLLHQALIRKMGKLEDK